MKRRFPRTINILIAAVLFAAVALVCVPLFAFKHPQSINGSLDAILPANVEGWQMRRLEIADSSEMRGRVMSILHFNDVLFRNYRRGAIDVQLYVAYWKPGTVPYGQAGVHTPDTCWVTNGWKQEERRHAQSLEAGALSTKPAEIRCFSMNGRKIDVLFWHFVGGQVHTYEQYGWLDGVAGVWQRLRHLFQDLRRYGLDLAQEQLFIRISSNIPVETLRNDPAFGRLLESLRPIGLFEGDKV